MMVLFSDDEPEDQHLVVLPQIMELTSSRK